MSLYFSFRCTSAPCTVLNVVVRLVPLYCNYSKQNKNLGELLEWLIFRGERTLQLTWVVVGHSGTERGLLFKRGYFYCRKSILHVLEQRYYWIKVRHMDQWFQSLCFYLFCILCHTSTHIYIISCHFSCSFVPFFITEYWWSMFQFELCISSLGMGNDIISWDCNILIYVRMELIHFSTAAIWLWQPIGYIFALNWTPDWLVWTSQAIMRTWVSNKHGVVCSSFQDPHFKIFEMQNWILFVQSNYNLW